MSRYGIGFYVTPNEDFPAAGDVMDEKRGAGVDVRSIRVFGSQVEIFRDLGKDVRRGEEGMVSACLRTESFVGASGGSGGFGASIRASVLI